MTSYDLWLEPEVHHARKDLPGNFRQQIKRAVEQLAVDPRPAGSAPLDVSEIDVPLAVEVRRLRLPPWRIIYAVNDDEQWVWVLAIYRRPPYDYEDLDQLVAKLQ
jgi:mRNA-degrading endonuclease RelE of RelBE toxin-antitoxin system